MRLIPTRYFSEDQLRPEEHVHEPPVRVLSNDVAQRIENLAVELRKKGSVDICFDNIRENNDLSVFMAFLRFFGVVNITQNGNGYCLSLTGPLSEDVPYVISLFLKYGFTAFEDWSRRYRTTEDQLSSLEFLHHIELQRIHWSRQIGQFPEVIRKVPVSFALIKAHSKRRNKDVYLMELNKDWKRYNFIGGKQEQQDKADYELTLFREIEEELGIPRNRVFLTPVTKEPLNGYSLSGSRGAFSYYPCMLYWTRFKGPFQARSTDRWLTETELSDLLKSEDPGLMINPVYLDFLFNKLPGGLKGLDYSLDEPIESEKWHHRLRNYLVKNKEWVLVLLALIAAAIGLIAKLIK